MVRLEVVAPPDEQVVGPGRQAGVAQGPEHEEVGSRNPLRELDLGWHRKRRWPPRPDAGHPERRFARQEHLEQGTQPGPLRVAVAGLNPHAGEGGLFGREDIEIIAPAVAQARAAGIDASGPWAGDTIFMRARKGEFDIVVAQYHDQGLIPVKYLGVDEGVNVTVGLPFPRTSVDHGTAFDIAGKGVAEIGRAHV